ncbi:MAG: hypothetical protein ACUVSU_11490 [Aggregatilineaceae bacterium]
MAPVSSEEVERAARLIEDTLISTEKVRDGLRDDEAIPFVEWGLARARQLAVRLTASATASLDEEQVADTGYSLARLMTRINWLVTYRHKKDAAWLTRTFQMINQLSRDLYGDDAPTFSDEEIATWLASQATRTNAELIADLMARLTPDRPPDTALPATPAPPLPGRPSPTPAPESPPFPGDEHGSPEQ